MVGTGPTTVETFSQLRARRLSLLVSVPSADVIVSLSRPVPQFTLNIAASAVSWMLSAPLPATTTSWPSATIVSFPAPP